MDDCREAFIAECDRRGYSPKDARRELEFTLWEAAWEAAWNARAERDNAVAIERGKCRKAEVSDGSS